MRKKRPRWTKCGFPCILHHKFVQKLKIVHIIFQIVHIKHPPME